MNRGFRHLVLGSDDPARSVGASTVPAAHAEGRDQHQDPERHGVEPDQPYERDQPDHGAHYGQDHPEEHRECATDDQCPFARYLPTEPDCHSYLGDALDDGPDGDEVQKEDGGQPWQDEGDQASNDAGDSFDEQQPAGSPTAGAPEHAHYREYAVDEGVGAEQQDQCLHGDPRPQERGQPEEYGEGAAQGQSPPVSGLRRQCRLWLGHNLPPTSWPPSV